MKRIRAGSNAAGKSLLSESTVTPLSSEVRALLASHRRTWPSAPSVVGSARAPLWHLEYSSVARSKQDDTVQVA
jgi:hypothetical protein